MSSSEGSKVSNSHCSITEAARFLELSRQRVWQLVRDKKLKAEKVGRQWVIPIPEIRRHIEEKGKV